jgi:hypothetical protein
MSQIDDELTILKQRLAALEEQKRIEAEKEAEKKTNPIKILGEIVDEKKKLRNLSQVGRPSGRTPKEFCMSTEEFVWLCDQNDKAKYLEPIFNILKSINDRLDALENKKKESLIENLF